MNKFIGIGNITRDVELKKTSTDKSVVSFTIAVNEGNITEFVDCEAWNKSADLVAQYCKKGSKLLVEGKIRSNTYEGKTGKVKKTYILVDRIEFLSAKPTEEKHDSYVEIKGEDLPFY